MKYVIREMHPAEYPLLEEFLYQAIFQRDETNLLPRSIIERPEIQVYIKNFGYEKDDYCLCTEVEGKVVGAVWVRNIEGYGNIGDSTPEFAISLYKEFRGAGIGTSMMKRMLEYLKDAGYPKTSLAVQKDNYALKMYQNVGFQIIDENEEEYIMVHYLTIDSSENRGIIIRQETPGDYDEVYELVKSAFLKADFSDGTEADYLNEVRKKDEFLPELSLVAETPSGKLVGQIVLYRTRIKTEHGTIETLVLSPISVHPDYFRRGIARAMINRATQFAVNMGFTSVFLCGDPIVYHKLGFVSSYTFKICHVDDPKAEWCMARELVPNALAGVAGTIDIV